MTAGLQIPTVGIGAGPDCDAQVLVWQDMAGLRGDRKPAKFVKEFADVGSTPAYGRIAVRRRGSRRGLPGAGAHVQLSGAPLAGPRQWRGLTHR